MGAILSLRRIPASRRGNRPFQGLHIGGRVDPGLPKVALGYALSLLAELRREGKTA